MKFRRHLLIASAALIPCLVSTALPQARPIDTAKSHVHIRVFKSGLFSGFGDNHDVEAPIKEGTIDENASRVSFIVDSRAMRVLDPQMSANKRQQVQERMLGPDVLDSSHFPQIAFESTSVQRAGPDQLLVTGQLSLHGVTRKLTVTVRKNGQHYVGTCALKQRDFAITPVSIAGGTVKVKDELKIEFDIQTRPGVAAK
jgi:polyisoprenoid-binding protein YceI